MTQSEFQTLRNERVAIRGEMAKRVHDVDTPLDGVDPRRDRVDRRLDGVDERPGALGRRLVGAESRSRIGEAQLKTRPDILSPMAVNGLVFARLAFAFPMAGDLFR